MRSFVRWVVVVFLTSCEGVVGELPLPMEARAEVTIDELACDGPATVQVPVTCRVRASATNSSQPISCVVTTGAETKQFDRCDSLQTFTLTHPVAGSVEVRATASSGQATAVRSVVLDVNAPGNTPPRITRFVATQSSGTVPFTVPLEYSVSDPENDPLGCALDIGADGSEDASLSCTAGAATTTLRTAGLVRLRLVVTDGRGGRATADVDVQAIAQNLGGGTAGGATAGGRAGGSVGGGVAGGRAGGSAGGMSGGAAGGRAGGAAGGASGGSVGGGSAAGGTAGGSVGGGAASGVDLRPVAVQFGQTVITPQLKLVESKAALVRAWLVVSGGTASGVTAVAELRRAGAVVETVNLTLPATLPTSATPAATPTGWATAFIPASQVHPNTQVVIRVDPSNAIAESDETNNELSVTPTVGRANQLNLTHVPVVQSGLTGVVPNGIVAYILDRWPAATIDERTRAPYSFSGALTGSNSSAWSTLLTNLSQARTNDGSSRNYYGWTRVSYRSGVAGIGTIGRGVSTGRDDSLDTTAHELGHNFGRDHAPCGVSGDANFPHANASIGVWGIDSQGSYKDPARLVDLMSYCDPTWVSDYSYLGVQAFMEGRAQFVPGQTLMHVTGGKDGHLLAGRWREGRFEFRPVYRVRAPASVEPLDEHPLTLRLTFTDGSKRDVAANLDAVGDGDERVMATVVEEPRSLRRVEAVVGGVVVGSLSAGAEPTTAFSVQRQGERVRVLWNRPDVSVAVTHVAVDGQRTTLTLDAVGGASSLPLGGLTGGELELSASTGLASSRWVHELPDER